MKSTNSKREILGDAAGYFVAASTLVTIGLWFHTPVMLLVAAIAPACAILYKFTEGSVISWAKWIWISIACAALFILLEVVLPNVGKPDFSLAKELKKSPYLPAILMFCPYGTIVALSGLVRSLIKRPRVE